MKNLFEFHPELRVFGPVFLHGSRAMEIRHTFWENDFKLSKDSDWDYAAQATDYIMDTDATASQQGWTEVVDKAYCDNDTIDVFEKDIEGHKVQVSLRRNLRRYRYVFSGVSTPFYFKYLWKKSEHCLDKDSLRDYWNSLYFAYDAGLEGMSISEIMG